MRYQTLLLLVFSFFSVINALQLDTEVEHVSLEARAKKGSKGKSSPHPKPKPLPPKNRPKPKQQPHEPKEVKCDPLSKYSASWFIANACKRPSKGKCLFYTYKLSTIARKYAKKNDMITIWDMWSKDLYDNSITKKNKLRCIFQNKKPDGPMRTYFAHMSQAMATMCDSYATVMDRGITLSTKNFDAVNKDGIWYKTEFPQLHLGGLGKQVQQIEAISPDGNVQFTYWTRSGVLPHDQKRSLEAGVEHNTTHFSGNYDFDGAFNGEDELDFDLDDFDSSWFDEEDDDDVDADLHFEHTPLELRSPLEARLAKCPLSPGAASNVPGQFDAGGSHPIKW